MTQWNKKAVCLYKTQIPLSAKREGKGGGGGNGSEWLVRKKGKKGNGGMGWYPSLSRRSIWKEKNNLFFLLFILLPFCVSVASTVFFLLRSVGIGKEFIKSKAKKVYRMETNRENWHILFVLSKCQIPYLVTIALFPSSSSSFYTSMPTAKPSAVSDILPLYRSIFLYSECSIQV